MVLSPQKVNFVSLLATYKRYVTLTSLLKFTNTENHSSKATRKKTVVAPPPPSESESEQEEEEESPPPSPSTQRRSQWAAYRQKQVDAHQARQTHYMRSVDKMLGF